MANITKRAAKRVRDHLHADETVSVAILVEPKGTYGPGMAALAAAPLLAGRALAQRAEDANRNQGGLAAGFPGRSCAVVATDRRVLVVPSNGLSFGEPVLVVDRGAVQIGDVRRKGLGRRARFTFTDGSSVEVDAQRGQPIDELEALLAS